MFSRGRHGARTVEAFGPFPSPARRPSLQSYIQSRLFGLLYGSSIFLSMEQRLRRQGPLLRRVEIRASPLNSLGLRLDPQASVELDRLLLTPTYSVDHWAVPALSALCRRTAPLTLSEARQMDIEDIVLWPPCERIFASTHLELTLTLPKSRDASKQQGNLPFMRIFSSP